MVKYNPKKWNDNIHLQKSHNCYSYFLNKIDKRKIKKCKTKKNCVTPQPGYHKGLPKHIYNMTRKKRSPNGFRYQCENVVPRVLSDNPHIKFNGNTRKKCNKGYYSGALVTTSKDSWDKSDYHFYRKDTDTNTWSHKTGKLPVTNTDANGNKIFDPYYAARKYARNDYSNFCGYFCIPEKKLNSDENKTDYQRNLCSV